MPLYVYECETCKGTFELRHSIKEHPEECAMCETRGALRRIPPIPTILKKKESNKSKPGTVVKKFIEEAKEDLQKEKEENRQRERE